jgi:hypothetical protein
MALRNTIQNNQKIAGLIACVAIGASVFYIARRSSGVGATSGVSAYFSADDGKTWFKDDMVRTFPFDHGGEPAYRAEIFRCSGLTFCAYLEMMPDSTRDGIDALPPNWQARYAAMQSNSDQFKVKRPGDTKWLSRRDKQYEQIVNPKCPDGSGATPEHVNANTD